MFDIPSGFTLNVLPSGDGAAVSHYRIDGSAEHITVAAPAGLRQTERFGVRLQFLAEHPERWARCAESYHFIPNIKQNPEDIAGAHVFRSPVVILSDGERYSALIPDLESIRAEVGNDYYLDLRFAEKDGAAPFAEYGIVRQAVDGHRYYRPTGEPVTLPENFSLSFYLLTMSGVTAAQALEHISRFLFERFAAAYERSVLPQTVPFDRYALYGNGMASSFLYQKHGDGGGICLTTFRREDGQTVGREYANDQWFHTWFNNMRTAHEFFDFGRRQQNEKWLEIARAIPRLLLTAPQNGGLFPTVYAPENGGWISSSMQGGGPEYYSLPDCAWAAYWLLRFERECEPTEGAKAFLQRFADGLLTCARPESGYVFPTWVDNPAPPAYEKGMFAKIERKKMWFLFEDDTSVPSERLVCSTSAALPMWFLAEYSAEGGDRYLEIAKRCADTLIEKFLPEQRFEDFELYYSCSKKRESFYDSISRLCAQNTLSMQWCAEGFLAIHRRCGEPKYLEAARYCIAILTLYQQIWNPPFLSLYAFGGFGVMNTDAEWNDARQAQFGETLANFYDATGDLTYLRRAVAATRGSFTLVAMRENAAVSKNTFEGTPVLFEIHGASSENYGHGGGDARAYQSGFHWGTGSALVTAAKLTARYGDLFIDGDRAVGIDGVAVRSAVRSDDTLRLSLETLPEKTELAVKFSSAKTTDIAAEGFVFDRQRSVLRRCSEAEKRS